MKLKQTIIVILGAIIFALGGGVTANKLGSIQEGQAYNATTTNQVNGELDAPGEFRVLKSGPGVFGSFTVTAPAASSINFYDASTTVNGGIYGTTTLAKFSGTVADGTYVFDAAFSRGLVMEVQSTLVASGTVTWR